MNRRRQREQQLSTLCATVILACCVGRCHSQTTDSSSASTTPGIADQTSSIPSFSNNVSSSALSESTTVSTAVVAVVTTTPVGGSQMISPDTDITNQASASVTPEPADVSISSTQTTVPGSSRTSNESMLLPSPSTTTAAATAVTLPSVIATEPTTSYADQANSSVFISSTQPAVSDMSPTSIESTLLSSPSSSTTTATASAATTTTTTTTASPAVNATSYVVRHNSSLALNSTLSLEPETQPTSSASLTAAVSTVVTSPSKAATESNSSQSTIATGSTTTTTLKQAQSTDTTRIASTTRPYFAGWTIRSVKPVYGPEAGGTVITITGEWLNASSTCRVVLGRNDTQLLSRTFDRITAETVPMSYSGTQLPISVVFDNVLSNTGFSFVYRQNPIVFDLQPRDHIVNGGTHVNVSGSNMNASASPKITLSTVITALDTSGDRIPTNVFQSQQACRAATEAILTCTMPPVDLTPFSNDLVSCTGLPLQGAVASICAANGVDRADVFIGLQFDGFTKYNNITCIAELPGMVFVFSQPPSIDTVQEVMTFDPKTESNITVKGVNMLRGCRIEDYTATVGAATCQPIELLNDSFTCRPPVEQPANDNNNTVCGTHLNVAVRIGLAVYHYACLDYKTDETVKVAASSNNNNLAYISLLAILVIVGVGAVIRAHYCAADPEKDSPESPPAGKYSQLPLRRSADAHQSFVNDAYDDAFHMVAEPTSPPTSPNKTSVTVDVHEPPLYSEVKRAIPNGNNDLVSVA